MTYGLTWLRERRRILDAYRAPQRHAIGDIITETHALMIRELEMRTALTELVEQIRRRSISTCLPSISWPLQRRWVALYSTSSGRFRSGH
jgi:hypothetical protein